MPRPALLAGLALLVAVGPLDVLAAAPEANPPKPEVRIIRARVQPRPGAEVEEVDMKVHPSPTELTSVGAGDAPLADEDLVLGVIIDGRAMAYPVRYLAMYEIVDDRVGETPVAPSW